MFIAATVESSETAEIRWNHAKRKPGAPVLLSLTHLFLSSHPKWSEEVKCSGLRKNLKKNVNMWVINNAKLSEITTLCMCWKEQTIWLEAKRNHRARWEQRLIRWCHSEKKWQTDRIDHYITTSILWIQSFSFFLVYIIHFGGNMVLVNQFQLMKSTLIYISASGSRGQNSPH